MPILDPLRAKPTEWIDSIPNVKPKKRGWFHPHGLMNGARLADFAKPSTVPKGVAKE